MNYKNFFQVDTFCDLTIIEQYLTKYLLINEESSRFLKKNWWVALTGK